MKVHAVTPEAGIGQTLPGARFIGLLPTLGTH